MIQSLPGRAVGAEGDSGKYGIIFSYYTYSDPDILYLVAHSANFFNFAWPTDSRAIGADVRRRLDAPAGPASSILSQGGTTRTAAPGPGPDQRAGATTACSGKVSTPRLCAKNVQSLASISSASSTCRRLSSRRAEGGRAERACEAPSPSAPSASGADSWEPTSSGASSIWSRSGSRYWSWCRSLLRLIPGDPVDAIMAGNPQITEEDKERLRDQLGLNDPIPVQIVRLCGGIAARRSGRFAADCGHRATRRFSRSCRRRSS